MIIKDAKVFKENGTFNKEDIYIENGIFSDISSYTDDDGPIIDGSNLLAIPGLVDIHFHGAVGCDFCDAEIDSLKRILDYELSCGVMAVCPATMTFPEDKISKIIDSAIIAQSYLEGADLIGINLEGPFINPSKVAAQNPNYVTCGDAAMLRRLLERGKGLIKLVDVAPEIEENMSLIDKFKDEVRFSLAHTLADYDKAKEAFGCGANHLTHMFNAMNEIGHRAPGPVLAALEEGAFVELISDGVHNHDAVIRMVFKLFDEDKIILISDSMMATGLEDGLYTLGGQKVLVKGNECRLSEHPETIAGSNTNLFECLKYAVLKAGVPIEKAISAVTVNPAEAIGVRDKYGCIRQGCYGNVILMDEKFIIKHLIYKGTLI